MNDQRREAILLQMLWEMCQEETMEYVLRDLRNDLKTGTPGKDAVRAYQMGADSDSPDDFQREMLMDKMLEIAEVNFRTSAT